MSIISQETWDNMSREEKEKIRTFVSELNLGRVLNDKSGTSSHKHQFAIDKIEELFGKENLHPKPEIKIWEDVITVYPEYLKDIQYMAEGMDYASPEIYGKILATYKIAKLIELGYGGMVTEEEWRDENAEKWSVLNNHNFGDFDIVKMTIGYGWKSFISFHTKEQADEFMSYPENVKLVMQYYMI